MSRLFVISAAVIGLVLVLQPAEKKLHLGSSPVVVELFTSQGCSSCPPADELLGAIALDPSLRGRVIPLAFHVDYWNHLGWSDPFSSAEWSRRQLAYARALGISGAYTPQAVVDGRRELIGSNARALYSAIEEASKRAPTAVLRIDGNVAHVDAPRELELIALTVGDAQTTSVARGENEGRQLTNYAIVKKLTKVGTVRGKADRALPAGTNVVLLQDAKTMEIVTAATARTRSS